MRSEPTRSGFWAFEVEGECFTFPVHMDADGSYLIYASDDEGDLVDITDGLPYTRCWLAHEMH